MTEFFVFVYAMLTMFVIVAVQRNKRAHRPIPQMMTMVGWGLFSLSSTLALLMAGFAVALAFGVHTPVPGFEAGF